MLGRAATVAGRSAGRRVLRRIVVLAGVAAAGAVALVRRRRARSSAVEAPAAMPSPSPAAALPPGPPEAREAEPATSLAATDDPSTEAGAGERSREELYRQAREIGLKGRSRMTKAQLEAALREHGR